MSKGIDIKLPIITPAIPITVAIIKVFRRPYEISFPPLPEPKERPKMSIDPTIAWLKFYFSTVSQLNLRLKKWASWFEYVIAYDWRNPGIRLTKQYETR